MSGFNTSYNLSLEASRLQDKQDSRILDVLSKYSDQTERIRARMTLINSLSEALRKKRQSMNDNETTSFTDGADCLAERIEKFNEEVWPTVEEDHRNIITDDHHPFFLGNFDKDRVPADKIDDMIDRLRTLLEQDQYLNTYTTHQIGRATDDAQIKTEMLSQANKNNPSKKMVDNQRTG